MGRCGAWAIAFGHAAAEAARGRLAVTIRSPAAGGGHPWGASPAAASDGFFQAVFALEPAGNA